MYKINVNPSESLSPSNASRQARISNSSPKARPSKIQFSCETPKLPALLSPNTSQLRFQRSLSPMSPAHTSTVKRSYGLNSVKKALTPMGKVPKLLKAVYPLKSNGLIKSYAANTCTGIVRTYNEDRISISYRVSKPKSKQYDSWPSCSWFGLFDGHGGSACADFLRDNLIHFVINQDSFPANPRAALVSGFSEAEASFMSYATKSLEQLEGSGSCAIVALIVESTLYIANVGDSRAVLSMDRGSRYEDLSNDHKPNDPNERSRIFSHGGKIFSQTGSNFSSYAFGENAIDVIHRVMPGRLSVSRTFGDAETKLSKVGVVIAEPEVRVYEIRDNFDFIVLGCDGIFDKLSSSAVVEICWRQPQQKAIGNFHAHCGGVVNSLLVQSMNSLSTDNLTAVIISFKNFARAYKESSPS